ncbi:MAG: GNAT family N-acetyltransferase [Nocardioidaceae bacterium]|nr:GNAT family N-acetyltransferase [Nocardioidaceae bacterium]
MRSWRQSDVARLFDIYSRWEVAQWLGSDPQVMATQSQAEQLVERWNELNGADGFAGRWAVERKADGVVAGTVILIPLPDGDGEFEVGWHFHPDSWGQGLATESARAALTWGFQGGLAEVFAVVRPGNDRSMAVCRRLGMTELGLTSKYYSRELELFRCTAPPSVGDAD